MKNVKQVYSINECLTRYYDYYYAHLEKTKKVKTCQKNGRPKVRRRRNNE